MTRFSLFQLGHKGDQLGFHQSDAIANSHSALRKQALGVAFAFAARHALISQK